MFSEKWQHYSEMSKSEKTYTEMEAPKPKRKRLGWSEGSEAALLDMWPERLEELRGQRKNGHIYAEMADDLRKLGYTYSSRDVQVKLQNFTQRYRKEKAAIGVSGGSPSTWPHYERVHQIIGGFKANLFNELSFESIDDISIPSNSEPSPSSSTSPLPPSSPVLSVTPTASLPLQEPGKKKGLNSFQSNMLKKFQSLSAEISNHLKKNEEIEKELIELEKQKVDSLRQIAEDNKEIKAALITFLNKN